MALDRRAAAVGRSGDDKTTDAAPYRKLNFTSLLCWENGLQWLHPARRPAYVVHCRTGRLARLIN